MQPNPSKESTLFETVLRYIVIPQSAKTKPTSSSEPLIEKEQVAAAKEHASPSQEIARTIDALINTLEEDPRVKSLMMRQESAVAYSMRREVKEHSHSAIAVSYRRVGDREEVDISITSDEEEEETFTLTTKKRKQATYSLSLSRPLEKHEPQYEMRLQYRRESNHEQLDFEYRPLQDYAEAQQESLHNFENRVPSKVMALLPKSIMGGILGYTYLGENFMARRDDLTGELAREVDIHESIHTPDEYETRVLTWWMMEKHKKEYTKHEMALYRS